MEEIQTQTIETESPKWYDKPWIIVIWLLFLWPVGLYGLIKSRNKNSFLILIAILGFLIFAVEISRQVHNSSIVSSNMNSEQLENEAHVIIEAYMQHTLVYPDTYISKGFQEWNTTHNKYSGKFSGFSVVHYYIARIPYDAAMHIKYEYSQTIFLDSNLNITYVENPIAVKGPIF